MNKHSTRKVTTPHIHHSWMLSRQVRVPIFDAESGFHSGCPIFDRAAG
jgi:hypothetical protein